MASFGDTNFEALRMLAEVPELQGVANPSTTMTFARWISFLTTGVAKTFQTS